MSASSGRSSPETARYVVGKMLCNAGFRVIEAGTGADAIEMCERLLPDVVVLDIKLPDIDGYEVCRRIKGAPATASIGVLHTSATFATSDRKVHGLEAGADGYLTQPFEPAELVAVVKSLLRIKQQEQELRARNELLAEADRR